MNGSLLAVGLAWAAPPVADLPTPEVFVHRRNVEDLAFDGRFVWAATGGGLEQYAVDGTGPLRVFDRSDGLDELHILQVEPHPVGLTVRTPTRVCDLVDDRFVCRASSESWQPELVVAPRFQGERVTDMLDVGGYHFVATAGAGLWRDGDPPTRLTPSDQICTNHAVALAEHEGALWIGGFDEGLCVWRDGSFETLDVPFRMVNDLLSHDGTLWVAASEGLFRTDDEHTFVRVPTIRRGANGLAWFKENLWVSTPAVAYRVAPLDDRVQTFWLPGGSRSLQKIHAQADSLWLATEDRGVLRWVPDSGDIEVFDRTYGLPSSWALDVSPSDSGPTYVGTLRDGVIALRSDGTTESVGGLSSTWVLDLEQDGPTLFVGTQSGAYRVLDDVVEALPGVPHSNVHRVLSTADSLWVATEAGLARYRKP